MTTESLTDRLNALETKLLELDVEFDDIETSAATAIKATEKGRDEAKAANRKQYEQIKGSIAQIDAIVSGVPVVLSGAKRSEAELILMPEDWEPNKDAKAEIELRGLDYAATVAVYVRQTRESGKKAKRFRSKDMLTWLDAQESDTSPPEAA